jgi:hypothetical protein
MMGLEFGNLASRTLVSTAQDKEGSGLPETDSDLSLVEKGGYFLDRIPDAHQLLLAGYGGTVGCLS